jgi:hypothetical protein
MAGTNITPRTTKRSSTGDYEIDWDEIYRKYVKPTIDKQLAPNTPRGHMYIIKGKGILDKSDYKGLDRKLVEWRQNGSIRWDQIADGSGRDVVNDFSDYQNSTEYVNYLVYLLKNGADRYRFNLNHQWRWCGQPQYVEFMTEKHAVVGTVAAHVRDQFVKVSYNKGNSGWGFMHDNCERWKKELYTINLKTDKQILRGTLEKNEDKKIWKPGVHIFYLGDDDTYGWRMDKHIRNCIKHFGLEGRIEFKRIGVIEEQIEEYGLSQDFEGGGGYEIDALNAYNQDKFHKLLLDHIKPYFREDIHKLLLEKYPVKDINKMVSKEVRFLS